MSKPPHTVIAELLGAYIMDSSARLRALEILNALREHGYIITAVEKEA